MMEQLTISTPLERLTAFLNWTKDYFRRSFMEPDLDPLIPAKRYSKSALEIFSMGNSYRKAGNLIRAAEHYYKVLIIVKMTRENPEFFAELSARTRKELEEADRQSWRLLEKQFSGLYQGEKCELLRSMNCSALNLRTVRIPLLVITTFLDLWKRDRSSQGLLAGVLEGDELWVTHLFIKFTIHPTHLISLGWIQAHPYQAPFVTYGEMAIQYSMQRFVPEAVAVVCPTGGAVAGAGAAGSVGQACCYRLSEHGMSSMVQPPNYSPNNQVVQSQRHMYTEASHCLLVQSPNMVLVDFSSDRNNAAASSHN